MEQGCADHPVRPLAAAGDPKKRLGHPGRRGKRCANSLVSGISSYRCARGVHLQAQTGRDAPGTYPVHPSGAGQGWRDLRGENAPKPAKGWFPGQGKAVEL